VVETGHGSEGGGGKVRSVVLADEGVGVGGVADNDGLAVTGGVVVDGLADIDEDSAVVLKEVSTLHTRATRLGPDEEGVVPVIVAGAEAAGDASIVQKR